ncbi:hypothetical protein ACQQ2Q_03960 [Agrobacterium sp. ES01]|uniref:hypothetical protein n=1 Tax=Agrobacterium sp. ES01 TaxID=3420714 RepID=UPI003D1279D2
MKTANAFRVGAGMAGILMSCVGLSGCLGSPTYGTDKTAIEQLADDLGDVASIGANPNKNTGEKYNPRPELVMPPNQETAQLVQPQQSLASKENPAWLETPEETRARLRKEADDNKDNPNYRSPLLVGYGSAGTQTEKQKWEAFREARKIQQGSYLDQRRFLADPPTEYRAAEAVTLDDLGEPELKKAKRRKKEAKAAQQTSSWWMPFQ